MATENASTIEIRMPELGSDMTEADLVAWLVDVGDDVNTGDLIAEIETDKSTVEFESPTAGRILELCIDAPKVGVKIGELLARIEPSVDATAEATPPRAVDPSPVVPATESSDPPAPSPDVPATALARRIADQRGLDLENITPSGVRGRITKAAVESASGPHDSSDATQPTASIPDRAATTAHGAPLSRMRRTIATRLSEAKREIPHFYLEATCAAEALMDVRRKLNEDTESTRLSINDFCVAAAARALRDVPEANVAWRGDHIERFESVDVAVAVAMPDGLITPVLRKADRLGLVDLSARLGELVARARSGELEPREYSGGFNVSNLGMYGISAVWPIVNPPHACILGLGAVEEVPVVCDGLVVPGSRMIATLSADHRAVDGIIGAKFLASFRRYVEHPLEMML
ncbi:MAG: dihydrolipoamide acetyltransferase family protein [Myxococcota bacterium]|nr:dihydrolipoamide acetyltransferase family protein [Myxococcota bacterium]